MQGRACDQCRKDFFDMEYGFLPHFRLYEVVSLYMCVIPYKYRKRLGVLLKPMKLCAIVGSRYGNSEGCRACNCAAAGTVDVLMPCDQVTGCDCKDTNTGDACDVCADGFYHPRGSERGTCIACHAECATCIAEGAKYNTQCTRCKHVLMKDPQGVDDQCRAACPAVGYSAFAPLIRPRLWPIMNNHITVGS